MAIREIKKDGDPILRAICKPVKEVNAQTKELIEDMFETMYEANGVGLAAPQVGIRKRIVVIDDTQGNKIALINPEITEQSGRQSSEEGCLSVPGFSGRCHRPKNVTVEALDENGVKKVYEAEGLLAVIFCHEIDHLDGILYKDKAYEYGCVNAEPEKS